MSLIALLAAQAPLADGGGLCALAIVGGQPLLERQAVAAANAGASRICVAVAEIPPELNQLLDRLRAAGLNVAVVRAASQLVAEMGDATRVMVVADGLSARPAHYQALAASDGAAVLVVPDAPLTSHLERIDAQMRWAGLAMVPAAIALDLASLPGEWGEWDIGLTLLRFAVQADARRIDLDAGLFGRGELAVVDSAAQARLADSAGAPGSGDGAASVGGGHGLGSMLLAPLVGLAAPWLLARPRAHLWAVAAGLTAWAAAAIAVGAGWAAAAAACVLLALLAAAATALLAIFRLAPPRRVTAPMVQSWAARVMLAALPWQLAWAGGGLPAAADAALALVVLGAVMVAGELPRLIGCGAGVTALAADGPPDWLLPDMAQVWLLLAAALVLGAAGLALAFLAVAALVQLLAWCLLARRAAALAQRRGAAQFIGH